MNRMFISKSESWRLAIQVTSDVTDSKLVPEDVFGPVLVASKARDRRRALISDIATHQLTSVSGGAPLQPQWPLRRSTSGGSSLQSYQRWFFKQVPPIKTSRG